MSTPTLDWLRARHAWVAAMCACLINALGTPLILWLGRDVEGLPVWPVASSAAFGALCTAVLMLRRRYTRLQSASGVFVANNAAVALCLWSVIPSFAAAGVAWTPFQGNKLSMLVIAALAPELVAGVVSIALMAACALGRLDSVAAPSAVDEPTVLLIFTVLSLLLLVLRVRGLRSEYALVQSKVDADAAHELSRRLLALRDLANTPLQTIEIGVALLEHRDPDAGDVTARISRAIARMRGLQPLMNSNAPTVRVRRRGR